MTKSAKHAASALPSKADILAFIKREPGKVGTREIARAFGLKNALRAELKQMLRDLADEGAIEKRRRTLHQRGTLPSTILADVIMRDADGDLLATPDEWDEAANGPAPKIRLTASHRPRPGEAAGVGDRALLRIEETHDDEVARYRGRVIKVIDRPKHRVLGIFRKLPNGGGRLEPVDKKMLGKEFAIPPGATADAQDGDLIAVETQRAPRLGPPTGRVVEKLGSLKSERAVSLIAINAHGIPNVFRRETLNEAEAAQAATMAHREDWRKIPFVTIDPPDAKDHDDAVHAEPDDARNNKGGFIVTVAIADVA
ncbi:MAG TPA: RNB domain-containing ribonuclease, partial [Pseudolabrys sp.]|nr:RNB domain-containing ribonuclease [Pseudolabrys sp.]